MNTKTKTIISIIVFAIFIGGAYFAYHALSNNYVPNTQLQLAEDKSKVDSGKEKKPASDFTVLDVKGNAVKLSDFFGKPIVLNFWASWCPPCKSEMPHFNKIYQQFKDDVTFLMVDLVDGQRETLEKGKKYIMDNGYSFPVYFDTKQEAANIYKIASIPTSLFIDKDGNIVTSYQGAIDEETLLAAIELIK